jgi:hypothetical protein
MIRLACMLLLSCSALVAQQTTPPHIHEAQPIEKLGYFIGTWTVTGQIKSPEEAGSGAVDETVRFRWMKGRHFVICDSEMKGKLGDSIGVSMLGYNNKDDKFVYHSFNSVGMSEYGSGTLDGHSWVWLSNGPVRENQMQRRFTITEQPPDKYSLQIEVSSDGKNWTLLMNGQAQRQPDKSINIFEP